MKKCVWILLLLAIVILAGGICGFCFGFHPIPEITDTKLQVFSFSHLNENIIYSDENVEIEILPCVYDVFKKEEFLREISEGDTIFVRVLAGDLKAKKNRLVAFSVLSQQGEYLSMDQTALAFSEANTFAYIYLALGIALSVFLGAFVIFLCLKSKK